MLRQLLLGDADKNNRPLLSRVREDPFRVVVIVLCLINITLALVNAGIFIIAAIQKLFVAADFTSFYTGFYIVRTGLGASLYEPELQSTLQRQFMDGITFEGGVLLFPNPPHVAILFSPLSFLRLDAAFYTWTIIQVCLMVWIFISLNRNFSHWSKPERFALFILIFAFWPLANSFLLGQFSLLLVLGLVQAYTSMRQSKFTQAGLWLFLLSIKPHTLLLPGVALLNRRYFRLALAILLISIITFIASSLIIGFQPWLDYIQSLRAIGSYFGQFGVTPSTEYTLRGLLASVLGNSNSALINTVSIVSLVIGMIGLWFLWYRDVPQAHSNFPLYFAITILLSVFLSLHLNPHDSLILILPVALFYDYLRQRELPKKAYSIFVLLWPLVFLVSAFYRLDLFGVVRLPILLILMLLVWMGYYLIRELREYRQAKFSVSA